MTTTHFRGSLSHWLNTSQCWTEHARGLGLLSTAAPQCLPLDSRYDCVIVGAGITGCAAAYHLRTLKPDLKVLVVEARGISEGATGRNGGLMWPSLNAPWPTTVAQYGEEGAKKLIEFEMHAFDDILAFVRDNHLEEELQFALFPDGAYSLCHTKAELDIELADIAAQQRVGLQPLSTHKSPQDLTQLLGPHTFVGGVRQDKVARLTAVRLAVALLRKAAAIEPRENLTVLQHMRVTAIQRVTGMNSHGGFTLILQPEDSGTIECGMMTAAEQGQLHVHAMRVAHCTNGYNHLLPQFKQLGWLVPVRNQVAVTSPLPVDHPMPQAAFYARCGYVYWSRRHDGRVVIGGFRDVTPHYEWGTSDDSYENLDPSVSAQLRMYLPANFPSYFSGARLVGPPVQPRRLPRPVPEATHNPISPTPYMVASPRVPSKGQVMESGGAALLHMAAASNAVISRAATAAHMGADKPSPEVAAARRRGDPFPIEYELEWSGILGFTKDRWPLVGALPPLLTAATPAAVGKGPTSEFCCMGFSGHGMTRAYTCARNLAHMLLDMPTEPTFPDRVFSPARVLQDTAPNSKL